MIWLNKKKKLKASYYHSFLALIVIPIFLIIVGSIAIIRTMMVDSATRNIRRAQENIVSTLGSEVKGASLRLSHFVYVNDSEIIKTAAMTGTDDVAQKYHYTKLLSESFNYAMVPVQDILSAVFYMKDGERTYMKDDIILSQDKIEATDWYQAALAEKNVVKVGFYDSNVTYSRPNVHPLIIVAALSPGDDVDRTGVLEMTSLFMSSRTGNLIREYNKEKDLGSTMLLKQGGTPVFDPNRTMQFYTEKLVTGDQKEFHHKIDGVRYVYVVSEEPVTGLMVVSVVAAETLTRDFNRIAAMIVAVTAVLFSLFYLFSSYFLKNIIEPVHNSVEGMHKVEEGNLEVHVEPTGQAELRVMIHSFNRMTRHLKRLIQENEEQQQKKHEAEIRALQSQINPHFLVNSLNSIRFIAQVSRYEAIAKMAEALIKILSCSFRSNAEFYTLKEELEVLDGFIYLMQIRYSDGFEIEYRVDECCMDCLVPRLILQPIVENSIVHGFNEMEDLGDIEVSGHCEEGFLVIKIRDNGKGMTQEEIRQILEGVREGRTSDGQGGDGRDEISRDEHLSIGITNVNSRLVLNYGGDCCLQIESEKGVYTETIIRLPEAHKGETKP